MSPILPVPVDTPPEGFERAQPRRWQPYPGYNLPVGQPGTEGYKLASFATLKTLSETYSILRTCLERRKNEIRALEWDVTLTPDAAKAYQGNRKAMRDFGERRAKALKFFRRPDVNYFTMESWLHAMMDQVFTIDALSLYMQPVKGRGLGRGLLGSDLDRMWLIDGSSMRPLMGLHGEVPLPPAPALQQYEFGVPRADLTTMLAGLDLDSGEQGRLMAQLSGDQMIYHPYLQRADSPYGFSLTEQALIPIMTGLRKQAFQLDYFSESTTPRVYISPGDNTLTPNQLRELQDALNATAGDLSWAFKIQVLPPGSKVMPVKDMEIVDQADEWIATEVAMVCDISPMELGILPKISTVASPFAAREMAQANRAVRERTATKPTLGYVSSVFNFILQEVCAQDDMRFTFEGMEETQDMAAVTDMGIKQVQSGVKSIDEVRGDLHLPPWGLPETSGPIVLTQMGPVPLGDAAADTVSQLREAITGAHDSARAHQAVEAVGRKALPAGTSGQGRMNGPVTQRQARRGGALAPAHATAEGAPGHSGGPPGVMSRTRGKAAEAELEALARHLAKGMPVAEWVPEHIPGHLMAMIAQDLESGIAASFAVKSALSSLPKARPQQQSRQQQAQAQLAARFQQQVAAAFGAALTAARALIAAWAAGTLAVTAATLAAMITAEIRNALLPALSALWSAAWRDAEASAGAEHDQAALEAFLATWGENWLSLIAATGEQAILDAINGALAAGDPSLILAALEDLLSDDRAATIAQNEVMRAWNAAVDLALRAAGIAYKRWVTSGLPNTCAACLANQAQGSIPVTQSFKSGKMAPLEHVNCRCHLAAGTPPETPVTGKVLRRDVGLNGQETWTEWEPEPGSTGGRVFQPHLADGTQVPQGGVPGVSAGGAPPRWDGSEPEPVVERAPDADDDAAYGEAAGIGARPGEYWPAPYMDGYWPAPHGHGMTQPGTSSPGSATGRPPNGVGKQARVSAALKGRKVPARVVYRQLLGNFPPEVLRWVLKATWVIADVPQSMIDYADEKTWAAAHQPGHVAEMARRYERGERVNPPVMVDEPGRRRLIVADGRHRSLARRNLGKPAVRAYVGTVSRRNGPWMRIYEQQEHTGSSPQNKSFTAGNPGLPGNVSGLVPLTVEGQRQGAHVAGLAVRAADTGRVLMLQRAVTDSDPAAGLWELPGGHCEQGESLLAGAAREWAEETGHPLPQGKLTGHWESPDGSYEGFVLTIPHESDLPLGEPRTVTNPDGDTFESCAFWDAGLIDGNTAVRPELRADYARFMSALNGGLGKSAGTPVASTVHHPLGHEGLWHTPSKKVPEMQQLPAYFQNTARAIARDGGGDPESKIPEAIEAVREWSHGTAFGGRVKVTPEVQAAATRAMSEWEALRESHAH